MIRIRPAKLVNKEPTFRPIQLDKHTDWAIRRAIKRRAAELMNTKMDEDEDEEEELKSGSQYNFFTTQRRDPRLSSPQCTKSQCARSACINNCDSIDAFTISHHSSETKAKSNSPMDWMGQKWGPSKWGGIGRVGLVKDEQIVLANIHGPRLTEPTYPPREARPYHAIMAHIHGSGRAEARVTIKRGRLNVILPRLPLLIVLLVVASFMLSARLTVECRDFLAGDEFLAANQTRHPISKLSTNRPRRALASHALPRAPINRQSKSNEFFVQTKQGLFKGRALADKFHSPLDSPDGDIDDENSVIGFFGIRYASAPVKRLRFMPPTAFHYAQNQVHNMQYFGPICKQRWPIDLGPYSFVGQLLASTNDLDEQFHQQSEPKRTSKEMREPGKFSPIDQGLQLRLTKGLMAKKNFLYLRPLLKKLMSMEQSEDCLNLNIYAPAEALRSTSLASQPDSRNQRPVLVIIHGESFDYGAGSTINGHRLARNNKLVVVTFNYRLNILGFPPKMIGASSGNLGLMDQIAALHWIKDNVDSFGGSPTNITLMGTKRGAIFVNLLMLSPMARGLFQRAIMEDGSALSPMVANHIASGSPVAGGLGAQLSLSQPSNRQPFGLLPGLQHIRLLAKLCNCPIYQRSSTSATIKYPHHHHVHHTANSSKLQEIPFIDSNLLATAHATSSQQKVSVAQTSSGHLDERNANAFMLECLKAKSVEQILQPVPFDLLHYDTAEEQLLIATRYASLTQDLTSLNVVPNNDRETKPEAEQEFAKEDNQMQNFVRADERVISRLALVAIKAKIWGQQGSKAGTNNKTHGELASDELFDAIYGSTDASFWPLFGPVVDGLTISDDGPAASMQRPNSSFSQYDLLIGLSQPILSGPASQTKTNDHRQDAEGEDVEDEERNFELGPEHLVAHKVNEQLDHNGLSNGQALDMVNGFVKTFYRYHNQEIANSIVNHYLGSESKVNRRLKASRYQTVEWLSDEANKTRADRQFLVLDSLFEAFQDALTSVPVLRTSLMHATKQLDTISEVFIGQQFEAWKIRQRGADGHSSGDDDDSFKDDKILAAFTNFAQNLIKNTNWPLEIHSPSQVTVQQPRATYLYQVDSLSLLDRISHIINKLENETSTKFKLLKQTMDDALSLLRRMRHRHNFGFECLFADYHEQVADKIESSPYSRAAQLLSQQIEMWICDKLARSLSHFVAAGRLKWIENSEDIETRLASQFSDTHLANFESRCLEGPQSSDLHSVKLNQQMAPQLESLNQTCHQELSGLAFDLVRREFDQYGEKLRDWIVFSPLSQQVISLPHNSMVSPSGTHQHPSGGRHSTLEFDRKSSFLTRSYFWANYVPALNCSRTQPVIPTSLLSDQLANIPGSNSTLLNLNLVFSCYQGGKTAYRMIEELTTSMGQQLRQMSNQWRVTLLNHFPLQQNHHILRMVNMSQTGAMDDQSTDERSLSVSTGNQNDPKQVTISGSDPTGRVTSRDSALVKVRYLILALMICGGVVVITIVSRACTLIRKKRQSIGGNVVKMSVTQEESESSPEAISDNQLVAASVQVSVNGSESHSNRTNQISSYLQNGSQLVYLNIDGQKSNFVANQSPVDLPDSQHPTEGSIDDKMGTSEQYYYWDDSHASTFVDDLATRGCQDPEPLMKNELPQDARLTTGLSTTDCHLTQEPIMMPILANGLSRMAAGNSGARSLNRRPVKCSSHSACQAFPQDSSSETQGRSSASSTKKRVKINDRPYGETVGLLRSRTLDRNKRGPDLVNDDPLYCPVHREQMMQLQAQPQLLRSGSFVCDTHFINHQDSNLWTGSYINLEPHGILKSIDSSGRECVMAEFGQDIHQRGMQ